MTSGEEIGTGGRSRQVLWMFYAAMAVFLVVNNIVNAVSVRTELLRAGRPIGDWEPFVWELTSAAMSIALLPLVAWLLVKAPPAPGRWLRFALVHIPATGVYSLIHVLGFAGLRRLIYLAVGQRYDAPLDLGYEYPKDLRSYVVALALLWLAGLLGRMWEQADQARTGRAAPVFDIRDGARLTRVRVDEIVAVTSAGNYVEVLLEGGRRPLMRATLASVLETLAPHGFVRTHRSWLVNPAKVRAVEPEGSGDFSVAFEDEVRAPLSRRFPDALAALRAQPR